MAKPPTVAASLAALAERLEQQAARISQLQQELGVADTAIKAAQAETQEARSQAVFWQQRFDVLEGRLFDLLTEDQCEIIVSCGFDPNEYVLEFLRLFILGEVTARTYDGEGSATVKAKQLGAMPILPWWQRREP